ncbi:MAG TPA: hypothetical protein VET29_09480 [Actinophytocola sp.]|nr:hypothetical protein [Actinophytocola sp.]HYQ63488.1 hypothetical protein [Actinophytocola sp.]
MLTGVLAGAEQLEGLRDQRTTLRVYGDGADLAAFGLGFANVEVAKRGLTDSAAVLDLLAHLVADVGTAGLGLVLVDGVDDGLDHGALGCLTHVENGGDHPYAVLGEFLLGNGSVDAVPEDPIEVVDDDEVRQCIARGSPDGGHHLLEDRPLVDAGCGPAWLDELVHHHGSKVGRLTGPGFPLGGNGNAFRVVVGVHLAGR